VGAPRTVAGLPDECDCRAALTSSSRELERDTTNEVSQASAIRAKSLSQVVCSRASASRSGYFSPAQGIGSKKKQTRAGSTGFSSVEGTCTLASRLRADSLRSFGRGSPSANVVQVKFIRGGD